MGMGMNNSLSSKIPRFLPTRSCFFPIRHPGSFDGAWLFGYGIGIHLLQSEDPESMPKISEINPKDNHISFQCESMAMMEKKLNGGEEGAVDGDSLY
ncbi:unnamed protein product [Linum trigynum]|uniref:Uncharacterized protein n=1 Tax=Linum trigynum TaxID=586398 RepID=A0AAV2CIG8_9ROSI